MTFTNHIRKLSAVAVATVALGVFAQGVGPAHADGPRTMNNLKQMGLASVSYGTSGDVDGRDFLAWQRGGSIESSDLNQWRTNFGVGAATGDSETVQHELGHTLGFRHEHTRSEGAGDDVFQWDPGDGDDAVDGRDFLIWQRQMGSTAAGDVDQDGDVDGRDFLVWQRGNSPAPLSTGDLAVWQANYGSSGY